jgi:hypothetical protein
MFTLGITSEEFLQTFKDSQTDWIKANLTKAAGNSQQKSLIATAMAHHTDNEKMMQAINH